MFCVSAKAAEEGNATPIGQQVLLLISFLSSSLSPGLSTPETENQGTQSGPAQQQSSFRPAWTAATACPNKQGKKGGPGPIGQQVLLLLSVAHKHSEQPIFATVSPGTVQESKRQLHVPVSVLLLFLLVTPCADPTCQLLPTSSNQTGTYDVAYAPTAVLCCTIAGSCVRPFQSMSWARYPGETPS